MKTAIVVMWVKFSRRDFQKRTNKCQFSWLTRRERIQDCWEERCNETTYQLSRDHHCLLHHQQEVDLHSQHWERSHHHQQEGKEVWLYKDNEFQGLARGTNGKTWLNVRAVTSKLHQSDWVLCGFQKTCEEVWKSSIGILKNSSYRSLGNGILKSRQLRIFEFSLKTPLHDAASFNLWLISLISFQDNFDDQKWNITWLCISLPLLIIRNDWICFIQSLTHFNLFCQSKFSSQFRTKRSFRQKLQFCMFCDHFVH
jgi:hypothetical protein